jgi:hypothetical protein
MLVLVQRNNSPPTLGLHRPASHLLRQPHRQLHSSHNIRMDTELRPSMGWDRKTPRRARPVTAGVRLPDDVEEPSTDLRGLSQRRVHAGPDAHHASLFAFGVESRAPANQRRAPSCDWKDEWNPRHRPRPSRGPAVCSWASYLQPRVWMRTCSSSHVRCGKHPTLPAKHIRKQSTERHTSATKRTSV